MKIVWEKLNEDDVIRPGDYVSDAELRIMNSEDKDSVQIGLAYKVAFGKKVSTWRARSNGLADDWNVYRAVALIPDEEKLKATGPRERLIQPDL